MGRIIRNGVEYGSGGTASNVVYLTQEAYDALPDDKLTDGVEYRITDANTSSTVARNIAYDNSESGLEATSVQGAIDTVNESLNKKIKGVGYIAKNVLVIRNAKPNFTEGVATVDATEYLNHSNAVGFAMFPYNNLITGDVRSNNGILTIHTTDKSITGEVYCSYILFYA